MTFSSHLTKEINDELSTLQGFYVLALTDAYRVGTWPTDEIIDETKVLELRVFNDEVEYKWYRACVGEKLLFRKLDDRSTVYEPAMEEWHLLDVDLKKSNHGAATVISTQGGSYYFPAEGKLDHEHIPCVKVKYYMPKYQSDDAATIHAYVKDWRLAGFAIRTLEELEGE